MTLRHTDATAPDARSEHQIVAEIRKYFGLFPWIKLFLNPVGKAWLSPDARQDGEWVHLKHASRVTYGLCVGSSDLIGWVIINGVARFLSLEVKAAKGVPSLEQLNFIAQVKAAGGIAGVVRSVQDVIDLLRSNGVSW